MVSHHLRAELIRWIDHSMIMHDSRTLTAPHRAQTIAGSIAREMRVPKRQVHRELRYLKKRKAVLFEGAVETATKMKVAPKRLQSLRQNMDPRRSRIRYDFRADLKMRADRKDTMDDLRADRPGVRKTPMQRRFAAAAV